MTKKEKLFAAKLLDYAANQFSNHCSNDLPNGFTDMFTKGEIELMDKKFHKWNGDPENAGNGEIVQYDWAMMNYCANLLRKECNND